MAFDFVDYEDYSWKEHEIFFAGVPVTKITGFRYGVETAQEAVKAAGDEPLYIKSGDRDYKGMVKVLSGALDDMNRAARAAGGRDITDVSFDIVTTYLPAPGRPLLVDTAVGFKISKFEKGFDRGAMKMEVELPGMFLRLVTE